MKLIMKKLADLLTEWLVQNGIVSGDDRELLKGTVMVILFFCWKLSLEIINSIEYFDTKCKDIRVKVHKSHCTSVVYELELILWR